jgi:hypothetical protein
MDPIKAVSEGKKLDEYGIQYVIGNIDNSAYVQNMTKEPVSG